VYTNVSDLALIAGVALAAFVSTSIDNLILLASLSGRAPAQQRTVMWGYVAAIGTVAVLGLAVARAADVVDTQWLGYIGVVPLLMGVYRLRGLFARPSTVADVAHTVPAVGFGAVFALMISNSSDTLGVVAPLFAETPEPLSYVIAATLVVMAFVWSGAAALVARQPFVADKLQRYERLLVPFILIGIGIYILLDTSTDTLV
jgi:cadmium resistance protein CadD (predicted permease)